MLVTKLEGDLKSFSPIEAKFFRLNFHWVLMGFLRPCPRRMNNPVLFPLPSTPERPSQWVPSLVLWWLTNSLLSLETKLGTSSVVVGNSLELGQAIFRRTTGYRLEAEGDVKTVSAEVFNKGDDIWKLFWPLSREHEMDGKINNTDAS